MKAKASKLDNKERRSASIRVYAVPTRCVVSSRCAPGQRITS